jgi:hypothetical protein
MPVRRLVGVADADLLYLHPEFASGAAQRTRVQARRLGGGLQFAEGTGPVTQECRQEVVGAFTLAAAVGAGRRRGTASAPTATM